MEIKLQMIQGKAQVTVDERVIFQGGRVAAKKTARQLARIAGVKWKNVKANGVVVLCD